MADEQTFTDKIKKYLMVGGLSSIGAYMLIPSTDLNILGSNVGSSLGVGVLCGVGSLASQYFGPMIKEKIADYENVKKIVDPGLVGTCAILSTPILTDANFPGNELSLKLLGIGAGAHMLSECIDAKYI